MEGKFVKFMRQRATEMWIIKQDASAAIDKGGNALTLSMTAVLDASNGEKIGSEAKIKNVPLKEGLVTASIQNKRIGRNR